MATKKKTGSLIGSWAFLIGVILAVLLAFVEMAPWMALVLVIVGLIVGLLNITSHEAMGFLTAAAVLVIVTSLGGTGLEAVPQNWVIDALQRMFNALMLVFVPATIIVALRAVFALAKN